MLPLFLLILFVLAWVILILPRQRELKRHQRLVAELQPGEEVMMTSGIYGTIVDLDDDYAQLEVADGVVLKIARRSIAARVEPGSEDARDAHEMRSAEGGLDDEADQATENED